MAVCESAPIRTRGHDPILRGQILQRKDFNPNGGRLAAKWLSHKEIGARVKDVRDALGVGQAEFARLLERPGSQSDIGKLERGERDEGQEPNVALLLAIAGLVGRGLDYFQAGGQENPERFEKLVAARWMEEMARRLREEATGEARPSPHPDESEDAEGGRRVAGVAGLGRGRKKVQRKRRGENDKTG